jgi:Phosphopantetheine attachment site.
MNQDGSLPVGGPGDRAAVDTIVSQLNDIVRELQGRPIDPDDNYFTAGLDSSTVVKLHALLIRRLDVWVPVVELYRHPTLRRTAARIHEAREAMARDAAQRSGTPAAAPTGARGSPAAGPRANSRGPVPPAGRSARRSGGTGWLGDGHASAGRDRRRRLRPPGLGKPGRVLGPAARSAGRRGDPVRRRAAGRRRHPRRTGRPGLRPRRAAYPGDRPVRRRLLRDVPGGGGRLRPPPAGVPGDGVHRRRARRVRRHRDRRRHRCVRRRAAGPVPRAAPAAGRLRDGPGRANRPRSGRLRLGTAGPARPVGHARLLLAARRPPGGAGVAGRDVRRRGGRWGTRRAAVRARVPLGARCPTAAGRPDPPVRHRGGGLRVRQRCRCGRAQAVRRGGHRRRPDPGGDPGRGHRPSRPRRRRLGGHRRRGPRRGRLPPGGAGVRRGARRGGRRVRRPRTGRGGGGVPARRWDPAAWLGRRRVGEVQRRAPRRRRRCRRAAQDGPRAAARDDPGHAARGHPEPRARTGRRPVAAGPRAGALAGTRRRGAAGRRARGRRGRRRHRAGARTGTTPGARRDTPPAQGGGVVGPRSGRRGGRRCGAGPVLRHLPGGGVRRRGGHPPAGADRPPAPPRRGGRQRRGSHQRHQSRRRRRDRRHRRGCRGTGRRRPRSGDVAARGRVLLPRPAAGSAAAAGPVPGAARLHRGGRRLPRRARPARARRVPALDGRVHRPRGRRCAAPRHAVRPRRNLAGLGRTAGGGARRGRRAAGGGGRGRRPVARRRRGAGRRPRPGRHRDLDGVAGARLVGVRRPAGPLGLLAAGGRRPARRAPRRAARCPRVRAPCPVRGRPG